LTGAANVDHPEVLGSLRRRDGGGVPGVKAAKAAERATERQCPSVYLGHADLSG
jgi:hypothetical protein